MISSKKLTTLFELFELVVLKNSFPMREVLSLKEEGKCQPEMLSPIRVCMSYQLTVTIAYSSIKPFFEPAKRHKKVRMSAAVLSTTGIRAEKRMVCSLESRIIRKRKYHSALSTMRVGKCRYTIARKGFELQQKHSFSKRS
jgi:hypothetical protein